MKKIILFLIGIFSLISLCGCDINMEAQECNPTNYILVEKRFEPGSNPDPLVHIPKRYLFIIRGKNLDGYAERFSVEVDEKDFDRYEIGSLIKYCHLHKRIEEIIPKDEVDDVTSEVLDLEIEKIRVNTGPGTLIVETYKKKPKEE